MGEDKNTLYVSERSWRNLWKAYRVCQDRVEVHSWIGKKVIPGRDLLDVEVRPPVVIGDLFRGKGFVYSFPLKVDLSDFFRHVAIHRTSGIIKHLRFTPDDPDKFAAACRSIMKKN